MGPTCGKNEWSPKTAVFFLICEIHLETYGQFVSLSIFQNPIGAKHLGTSLSIFDLCFLDLVCSVHGAGWLTCPTSPVFH